MTIPLHAGRRAERGCRALPDRKGTHGHSPLRPAVLAGRGGGARAWGADGDDDAGLLADWLVGWLVG